MIPKRIKTGAQWNPFDIKQRVSKSNLEANENDFFAKKKKIKMITIMTPTRTNVLKNAEYRYLLPDAFLM